MKPVTLNQHLYGRSFPPQTPPCLQLQELGTALSLLSVTGLSEMDPSLSSSGWTTSEPMLSPSFSLIDSAFSTMPSTMNPDLLGISSNSLLDTPASPSNDLPSTGTEQLSDIFMMDQSDDHEAMAELPNTGLLNNVDSPCPSSSLMFESLEYNTGMSAICLAWQQHEQQQLVSPMGDLSSQPCGLGAAGPPSLAPGGWGLTETTDLLLQDINCAISPPRMPSFNDPWIEQLLQQEQPPLQPLLDIRQLAEMQRFPSFQQEHQQLLQNEWLKHQQQHDLTTVSTPDHLDPQHLMWSWQASDQQHNLPSPQHSLQLEYPSSNAHHSPYTNIHIDYDYLQQNCPLVLSPTSSSSVSSSSFQHQGQHPSLFYEAFDHTHGQRQQQPHLHQRFSHIRHDSASSSYYHHYQHGSSLPVISSLKRRRRLTAEESAFLMTQFSLNGRPTAQERDSFAKHLKLDRRTIQVWFQNRRAKLKRDERGVSSGGDGGDVDDGDEQDGVDFEGTVDTQEGIAAEGREGEGEACMVGRDHDQGQQEDQQTIRQSAREGFLPLFPQYGQQCPFIPPRHCPLDVADLEDEFQGANHALNVFNYAGNDLGQGWSSSTSNIREMKMGKNVGLAQTARLGFELFSGHHCHYHYQQQHQQVQGCLPLVDSAFRDCPR